jgi:hypothetical protein
LIDFDIFRYVSIFLTYFGHKMGTNDTEAIAVDRPFLR